MTMTEEFQLIKCLNDLCMRKVKASVAYCCHPCSRAHEGNYEIHEDGPLGHSEWCNEAMQERGECTREEAAHLRQDRPY
jgi:hypothetical protein